MVVGQISRCHSFSIVSLFFLSVVGNPYTPDLLALERIALPSGSHTKQSEAITSISTPLVLEEWKNELEHHPDQAFAKFIIRGISTGFRIGFDRLKPLRSAPKNMQSALSHPEVVSTYIADEISAGRVVGPFPPDVARASSWHISRFGVIPKRNSRGLWRLILHLSWPSGASINDGIDPALTDLHKGGRGSPISMPVRHWHRAGQS